MIVPSAADAEVSIDQRRIDIDAYDDVYVVGDVHGCLEGLERLLSTLEFGADDLAVFVGDLVRKGPESKAVLERVRESPNLQSVRGNNEQKLVDGEADLPGLESADYRFIESLPTAISWDDHLVVHGGVDPARPLSAHSGDEVLTMRSPDGDGYDGPFWFDEYAGPPRVFFGHTVLEEPLEREWAVGLDTGCVYGGHLTAYDVRRERFVSVSTPEHEPRPDEKFATASEHTHE
ncbi:metallophosphoesterase family protein [Haloterrigena alkaliphila]|uniref:Serine/threonine protein phosphatase n=1 Tax=Haloterrigena alkaliphila TaxID=2816475 RepID=A0A8A2VJT0_9EURY|nr:metallophosphoesterase family protein [Haloterrigena alkaliphila]QSX00583.1 serine/threonine protein phosphatase [Haloterrigena alkaliphila]